MENDIKFYSNSLEYNWLSNFYRSNQKIDGIVYPTNEHYYQSQKFKDGQLRKWILLCPKPSYIFLLTRVLKNEPKVYNWDVVKFDIMLKGLRAKFSQNKILKQRLLETGDKILHEDSPYDRTWGINGEDMLGKLLMKVREELRNDQ